MNLSVSKLNFTGERKQSDVARPKSSSCAAPLNSSFQAADLNLHKNNILPPSPDECTEKLSSILSSTGRALSDKDKEDFLSIFRQNKSAYHFLKRVAGAKENGFSPNEIKEILWVCDKNFEEETDELLNSDLTGREISQKIALIKNSDHPDYIKKLRPLYGVDFAVELANNSCYITRVDVSEEFDRINSALFGEKPLKIKETEEEFKTRHGVRLHMDYNISPYNAGEIEEAMDVLKKSGRNLPKDIYITNFLKSGTLGMFCFRHKDSVFLLPPESADSVGSHALLHEFVHMNDLTAKGVPPRGEELSSEIVPLGRKFVSKYSTTNQDEFIAEVGTLMLQGKIKIDEDDNILFKKEYPNLNGFRVSPSAKDISELIGYYFSIGGQVFESPDVPVDRSYARTPLEI